MRRLMALPAPSSTASCRWLALILPSINQKAWLLSNRSTPIGNAHSQRKAAGPSSTAGNSGAGGLFSGSSGEAATASMEFKQKIEQDERRQKNGGTCGHVEERAIFVRQPGDHPRVRVRDRHDPQGIHEEGNGQCRTQADADRRPRGNSPASQLESEQSRD